MAASPAGRARGSALGGVGAAAKTQLYPLPKDLRRYVRLKNVMLAAAGDNTAVSVTLSLVR